MIKLLNVHRSGLQFKLYKSLISTSCMAKSKYEYVKSFESSDICLPHCWIVIRVDGRNFHRFSDHHQFKKPNDEQAINLMVRCAKLIMEDFNDIVLSIGQSDEFSFVFRRETEVFQRRSSKLMSTVVSLFSSSYVYHWSDYFPHTTLSYPPSFDGRVILYPTDKNLRDYLSWRQADCHINNLHNTCYWKLVHEAGMTPSEAQDKLGRMMSSDKNEMLFSQFKTNYNNLPELFRKGTILVREPQEPCMTKHRDVKKDEEFNMEIKDNNKMENNCNITKISNHGNQNNVKNSNADQKKNKKNKTTTIKTLNIDIISDTFWLERPYLLTA